jgi:tetratricopeptide (TPR) repeat protein
MLGKDPGSLNHMEQAMSAAQKLSLPEVTKMYADILIESQRQAKKPNMKILQSIVNAYTDLEEFASAINACAMARKLDPDNGQIADIERSLSAKYAIKKGGYDKKDRDFRDGVVNIDKLNEQGNKDALLKSKEFLQKQIEKTKAEYLGSPLLPGKINAYVDALLKMEDEGYENEAADILLKANKDTQAYQFKMRVGDIKITQLKRQYHKAMGKGDKQAAADLARKLLEFELEEYAERSANYPTDLTIKFELGRRQYVAGKFDDAIGCLQQAARDPRRHVQALGYLGQAFARKQWYHEASETYERALQADMTEDRAKEIRYNLGDVFEKMGDKEDQPEAKREAWQKAQEQFSMVAQLDFQFKDVRVRLEAVRKKCESLK